MSTIGEVLKTERIRQNKSLKDIERETKIRAKYLLAIEKNDFDLLPGGIYPKVFIKAYCQALGIESSLLLEKYQELASQRKDEKSRQFGGFTEFPLSGKKRHISRSRAVVFSVIVLIACFFALKLFWPGSKKVQPGSTAYQALTDNLQFISIKVDKPGAWLRVTVDSSTEYEDIAPGDSNFRFKGNHFIIRTGNAALVNVSYNSSSSERLGGYGQIVEKEYGEKVEK